MFEAAGAAGATDEGTTGGVTAAPTLPPLVLGAPAGLVCWDLALSRVRDADVGFGGMRCETDLSICGGGAGRGGGGAGRGASPRVEPGFETVFFIGGGGGAARGLPYLAGGPGGGGAGRAVHVLSAALGGPLAAPPIFFQT